MTGKKAVHFGGGNIGRGFVGLFCMQAGYEVVFVDVIATLIEKLDKSSSYDVVEIGDDGTKKTTVSNFRAINSLKEADKVVDEIATADIVTCAVGPNILPRLAGVIASGLNKRKYDYPVAVIACENAIMATDKLKGFIVEKLDDSTKAKIDDVARFANSAVDRIVPNQDPDAGLDVKIESFYEWCVELPPFKGVQEPKVPAIHYVDNLEPYIERKLFTVNTGHATTAYFGKQAGKAYIHEALQDETIKKQVHDVLAETANLIIKKHKIPREEQDAYVDKIIKRFSNPALKDEVTRVGRQPLRKLSRNERLISPASQLAELGESSEHLVEAVGVALKFQNVAGDDESVELAKILAENDAPTATKKITGLDESHPLFNAVLERVKAVKG